MSVSSIPSSPFQLLQCEMEGKFLPSSLDDFPISLSFCAAVLVSCGGLVLPSFFIVRYIVRRVDLGVIDLWQFLSQKNSYNVFFNDRISLSFWYRMYHTVVYKVAKRCVFTIGLTDKSILSQMQSQIRLIYTCFSITCDIDCAQKMATVPFTIHTV